jgi:putative glutamine amidotransferase
MSAKQRPLIGINTDFYATSKSVTAHARVNAGYFDAVLQAGGLPILIPPFAKEVDIDPLLEMLDGMIMTGGLDLDPRRQGLPAPVALQPMAERRESSDRVLMHKIIERQMPLLAIGVGMQHLNLLTGGTMFHHIPNDCPKAMPHFDPSGPHRHIVLLEENTRIEEIYGSNELRVNSRHHMAVDMTGPSMRISGRCPDGVIEAIEAVDSDWFCIGVQYHPEAETASALDMQLFECFVQASTRSSNRLQLVAA